MVVLPHYETGSIPAFQDAALWLPSAWDVWLTSGATRTHIEQLAGLRLQALVALARERSPFYRSLYRDLPGEPLLAQLPVLTKRKLMANFEEVATDRDVNMDTVQDFLSETGRIGHRFLDRYAVWTSSGTTGEPAIYLHDAHALAVYEALQLIRFRRLHSPVLLAAAVFADDRYAFVGATGGHFAGHASVERLRLRHPWLADRVRAFSILQDSAHLVHALNAYQPTLLATYPTAADLLADAQQRGRLAIRPREVWTGGEGLSDAQRRHIGDAFGCPVRDDYGSSEFLSIAWDCGHGPLHVNSDWVLLEAVDAQYRPVPAGAPSHTVLLTNLANRIQPLIRYDLGDSITVLGRPCPCGSPFPAIRVAGRCDQVITLCDRAGRRVQLLPLAVTTVLEDIGGIHRFQLMQRGRSALRLRIDPAEDPAAVAAAADALRRHLRMQGLGGITLDIAREPLHHHPVSGKLQRILASC